LASKPSTPASTSASISVVLRAAMAEPEAWTVIVPVPVKSMAVAASVLA
jgi:hypothetical protein